MLSEREMPVRMVSDDARFCVRDVAAKPTDCHAISLSTLSMYAVRLQSI